jgi:hypothetical protein
MHVYDKAKYHDDTIDELGLPAEHATHHTLFFLRWLIDRDLTSDMFRREGGDILRRFRGGLASLYDLYEWWDNCLVSDMLSEEGNAFAMTYFDFEQGRYLTDYAETLQKSLPSEFHVPFTDDNYAAITVVLDRRFREWKATR